MKGIAFTLDAIFALVIAVAGIAILLYFQYYPESPFALRSTHAQAAMSLLLSTNTSSITGSSKILEALANQQLGSNQSWDQFMGQATKAGSQGIGPTGAFISNIINANAPITTGVVADYGNLYFAAGGTLYAVNASGYPVWTKNVGSAVSTTPALYDNMLIYWTSSGISAVSAFNGSAIWSTGISGASPGAPITIYHGEIIASTSGGNLELLYPNNGTVYSITTLSSGYGKSVATAAGSISAMSSTNTIILLTNVNGAATQGQIWSNSLAADSSGVASYADAIAYGDGSYANISDINGTAMIADVNTGSQVSGVAVSQSGIFVFQSASRTMAITSGGATLWLTNMPGAYGSAYPGTIPVISNNEVYSLWSNNDTLVAQNLSTGSVLWYSRIPYSPVNPAMTLAYGRLYVIAGSKILAYGSCNVDPQGSVLQVAATLYLNNQGSCADYILNGIQPLSNYSMEVGNVFLPGVNLATFNSVEGSYGVSGSGYQTPGALSISFWIYPEGLTGGTQYIIGSNPGNLWSIGLTSAGNVIFEPGTSGQATSNQLVQDKWQFVTMTAVDSFSNLSYALYINGIRQTSGTFVGQNIQSINNITFGSRSDTFSGILADVQVYGSVLNATQIGLLYQSGAQGGTLSGANPLSWWPLDGDANDYGVESNAAYTFNVIYSGGNYVPQGLIDAYEVGKASTVVPVLNYTTQYQNLYNIGVDSWR